MISFQNAAFSFMRTTAPNLSCQSSENKRAFSDRKYSFSVHEKAKMIVNVQTTLS